MINNTFYQGFEGEGEICFTSGENKLAVWEGYLGTILESVLRTTKEIGGMLEAYCKREGWYDWEPWLIEDVALAIRQLSYFDRQDPELPIWKDDLEEVNEAIVSFLQNNKNKEIFIEYN